MRAADVERRVVPVDRREAGVRRASDCDSTADVVFETVYGDRPRAIEAAADAIHDITARVAAALRERNQATLLRPRLRGVDRNDAGILGVNVGIVAVVRFDDQRIARRPARRNAVHAIKRTL
ncbi:hypothetical protein OTAKU_00010 [Serratia phage vB_SmaM-Otaku]|uniref:Uncharacterized protein n=1 Tax=Serratia phage vB_SmaM-Otaku TaxID=2932867 RepID=A0AAE9KT47_9CAUD|nr:hypothetical protein PF631_gp01 [Serratia phage vB_SmaM-Otaku]UPU15990.1 hypothetical protein OTAKU_00010 [Serratia phage vB_SmaM-Otaku]